MGLGSRVQRFRVSGLEVQGLGFRVLGFREEVAAVECRLPLEPLYQGWAMRCNVRLTLISRYSEKYEFVSATVRTGGQVVLHVHPHFLIVLLVEPGSPYPLIREYPSNHIRDPRIVF